MRHPEQTLLNEYVDDNLEGERRQVLESHLEQCPACRAQVGFLRQLQQQAADLPQKIEPPRDLWPQIADRLESRKVVQAEFAQTAPRRVWAWRLLAVAAVLVLALVSSLTTYRLTAHRQSPPAPFEGNTDHLAVDLERLNKDYGSALAELTKALQQRRNQLSPETVATLEKNLKVIDGAIAEASQALAADPGHPDLLLALASMYEKKVNLLQHLTHLPAEL